MPAEDEVQKLLSLLKRAIRSSGRSQKEVDRQIGVQPGYLSQVMIGRLDLKLKHLLRALEAIEVEPSGFFKLAFPQRSGDAKGADLLSLISSDLALAEAFPERARVASDAASRPAIQQQPSESGSINDQELRRMVARLLSEELNESGPPPTRGTPSGPDC